MGEIVNLRRARKAKAREESASLAAANRRKFDVTLAEKDAVRAEQDLAARQLDAHKRKGAPASVDAVFDVGPSGNRGNGD
jgi:hypothetical protein